MRFDVNAPGGDPLISTMTMSDQIAEAAAAFDQSVAYEPDFGNAGSRPGTVFVTSGETTIRFGGGLPAGVAGLARVIRPDGSPVPADAAEQRLAALDQLLSKGMLTQSEYETQRQRIIESI